MMIVGTEIVQLSIILHCDQGAVVRQYFCVMKALFLGADRENKLFSKASSTYKYNKLPLEKKCLFLDMSCKVKVDSLYRKENMGVLKNSRDLEHKFF